MSKCEKCKHNHDEDFFVCDICIHNTSLKDKFEPLTNADRIRAMSDEELANILNAFTAYFEECNRSLSDTDCHDCELFELCSLGEGKAIDWLKQPAETPTNADRCVCCMDNTKSCRECVHDNPDDYEKYCHCCITNGKTNWRGEEMGAILYHATTPKKAAKYKQTGHICKPVRGFTTIQGAMAWAMKVGRTVIYEVHGDKAYKLPDHHNVFGEAWWIDADVPVANIKCVFSAEKDA